MEALQDINGKPSAKRLWAGRYLLAALLMIFIHFLADIGGSIFGYKYSVNFPTEIWYGMVGGGFGILGVTIFESKTK